MELLIIKCGDDYLRVKDGHHTWTHMDKASVFGLDSVAVVRQHLAQLKADGVSSVAIHKLHITEELYEDECNATTANGIGDPGVGRQ